MLLKVQITMIWTTQVSSKFGKNFERKRRMLCLLSVAFLQLLYPFMMVYIYGVSTTLAIAGFTPLPLVEF